MTIGLVVKIFYQKFCAVVGAPAVFFLMLRYAIICRHRLFDQKVYHRFHFAPSAFYQINANYARMTTGADNDIQGRAAAYAFFNNMPPPILFIVR